MRIFVFVLAAILCLTGASIAGKIKTPPKGHFFGCRTVDYMERILNADPYGKEIGNLIYSGACDILASASGDRRDRSPYSVVELGRYMSRIEVRDYNGQPGIAYKKLWTLTEYLDDKDFERSRKIPVDPDWSIAGDWTYTWDQEEIGVVRIKQKKDGLFEGFGKFKAKKAPGENFAFYGDGYYDGFLIHFGYYVGTGSVSKIKKDFENHVKKNGRVFETIKTRSGTALFDDIYDAEFEASVSANDQAEEADVELSRCDSCYDDW